MDPKEHLRRGRSEVNAAKDAATDDELVRLLDNLSQGVELVAPDHRPIQPHNISRINIQIDAVVDESSNSEVNERLLQAKEHFNTVYDAVETEYSSGM